MKMSQKQEVLEYIKKNGSITQRDANYIGCYRLSARILELIKEGHPIVAKMECGIKANGKPERHARYSLSA